jgi:HPt (histidine-containing phosphotransfer) domain-containing protein
VTPDNSVNRRTGDLGEGPDAKRDRSTGDVAPGEHCLASPEQGRPGWRALPADQWPQHCLSGNCVAATDDIFDRGILDDLGDVLDDGEIDSYLALLRPTVVPRVALLVRQIESDQREGLLEVAHALSGGAACYGLVALSAAARIAERSAAAAQWEVVARAVADAAAVVDASLVAVEQWRCRWAVSKAAALSGEEPAAR